MPYSFSNENVALKTESFECGHVMLDGVSVHMEVNFKPSSHKNQL